MSVLCAALLGAGILAHSAGQVYVLAPRECLWLEAESHLASGGQVAVDTSSFGGAHVGKADAENGPTVRIACKTTEALTVWVRVRGRGIGLKCGGEPDIWRWPKCEMWRWVRFGPFEESKLVPSFAFIGTADMDVVVLSADPVWRPVETSRRVASCEVDLSAHGAPISPRLASANVNSPTAMLLDRADWHEAVRGLGIRMMRFQVPASSLDYRDRDQWDDETFASLDEAVNRARESWGVESLMFGFHRLRLPLEDGKLIEEEFSDYADALARFVKRYAPPGNVRVLYWEPFNELDHASFLKKLAVHGQDFHHVAKLYSVCSRAIKAVNPDVKVGGPSAMWPGGWETRMMLEQAGSIADFVSWHQYATGSATTSDDRVLQAIHREKGMVDGLRRMQKAVTDAGVGGDLEFLLTEYHINHTIWDPPDVRAANEFSAVYAASVLLNLGQQGVDGAMIHDVVSRHYGLLGPVSRDPWSHESGIVPKSTVEDPIHVRPVGWVIRWYNTYMRGVWGQCRWLSTPVAWESSPRKPVVEIGVAVTDRRAVVLMINRDTRHHEVLVAGLRKAAGSGDSFSREVEVATVDGLGARVSRLGGPSVSGRWMYSASPMSVFFAAFELARQP